MAITYTWNYPQFDVYPTYESQTDVVFTVHWILSGTDDNDPPNTAQVYGTQQLTYTAGSSFTPYNELTQIQVQTWVEDAMGPDQLAMLQANIAQQISNIVSPPIQTMTPPWG